MAEQSHAYQFWYDVEEIVGVSHCAKQETALDAVVGYDVEFHRPNVAQFIDDVKQHEVGKCHNSHADDRNSVKLHVAGISLVQGTKIIGYVGKCQQQGVAFSVLGGTTLDETFLVLDRIGEREQAQDKETCEDDNCVLHNCNMFYDV
ncbi:hypothetical protein HMPREF0654_10705 [Prevotella disiens DNF00882]|uniref:Uncharacterized protein n=1 Tax=Prevotella disiens DNF00882 TaxID=1401075 RepID=A0A096AJY2_9BACT|nr:hypothetical protein HMPREF0654_10705 [Prevotella disiens DNF00882]